MLSKICSVFFCCRKEIPSPRFKKWWIWSRWGCRDYGSWFSIVGLVLFSDCDRHGRRPLGCGSLLSGFFFPFWFASSLFYRRPLVVFVSILVVISDCGSGCQSALWINSWRKNFVSGFPVSWKRPWWNLCTRITTGIAHWSYFVWAILFHRFTVQVSSSSSLWFSRYFNV